MASLSQVRRLVVPKPTEVGGGEARCRTGTTVCVKVPLWLLELLPLLPLPPLPELGGGAGGLNFSTVVDTCAVSSMVLWVVL